jgi:hypothetical protein
MCDHVQRDKASTKLVEILYRFPGPVRFVKRRLEPTKFVPRKNLSGKELLEITI